MSTDTALSIFVNPSNRSGLSELSHRSILGDLLRDLTDLNRCDIYVRTDPEHESWVRDVLPESERFVLRTDGPTGPAGLPEKVQSTFTELFEIGYENVVALAADTPGLGTEQIRETLVELRNSDPTAVVGPAGDGGFYLLGLNRKRRDLLEDVPFYVGSTCRRLRDRLDECFDRIVSLECLNDVDRLTDWLSIRREWLTSYRWILRLVKVLVFGRGRTSTSSELRIDLLHAFLFRTYRSPPSIPLT